VATFSTLFTPLFKCMVRPVLKVIKNDGKSMANNLLTKKVKRNPYNGVLAMKFSSIIQIFDIYSSVKLLELEIRHFCM
jgi:hypothetical protein